MTNMRYVYRVFFFTGPALKVLSMELVPPKKKNDWSAQHIEKCFACNKLIHFT